MSALRLCSLTMLAAAALLLTCAGRTAAAPAAPGRAHTANYAGRLTDPHPHS